jgi:hypothetical protein
MDFEGPSCRTEAATLEEVLAKLECATQCIRDIVPDGKDPEQACDIELRFVFALERDVGRLVADKLRREKRGATVDENGQYCFTVAL